MSKQQMLEDLQRSGLTTTDATVLKLKSMLPAETLKLFKKKYHAYKIPYFDMKGRVIKFCRVRFLEEVVNKHTGKDQRYTQTKSSDSHLYLPPLVNWQSIANDPLTPIVITEGEKKAAKACKEGLNCIGLGGVWSFRSKKKLKPLIDEFYKFEWGEREVTIVYDSDLVHNDNVSSAICALAKELNNMGAIVYTGCIPGSPKDKLGLDDYLLEHSIEDFNAIDFDDYMRGTALLNFNNDVAFIKTPGAFYQFETGLIFSRDQIVKTIYPYLTYPDVINENMRNVSVANEWMGWRLRRTHERLAYAPGKKRITDNNEINVWKGWGCEPIPGDTKPWDDLINFIFQDDKDFKEWFIKWLAYPIQHPGTKLYSSVLLWSLKQGTGKSFIGYIMGKIYGENFEEVGKDDLEGNYNSWAVNKQFIMGEEITGTDKRNDADKLKRMITREKMTVKIKYVPEYSLDDCINYLFTSNHPDSMFIESSDRRTAVHEVRYPPMEDAIYTRIDKWKNNTGPSHLFYYLLNEVDVSDFNPRAHAIGSESKQQMQDLSVSDLDIFVRTINDDADSVLTFDKMRIDRDLFTITEILNMYDNDSVHVTKIAMSKALRRGGFIQLPVTKTASGGKRLWALRNCDKWLKASPAERIEDYDRSVIMLEKAKEKKFKTNTRVN